MGKFAGYATESPERHFLRTPAGLAGILPQNRPADHGRLASLAGFGKGLRANSTRCADLGRTPVRMAAISGILLSDAVKASSFGLAA